MTHAKWEKKEVFEVAGTIEEMQSAQCGNCGKFHTTPFLYYFDDYNYCPFCGARMDGELFGNSEQLVNTSEQLV